jgi:hypothetical protein
MADAISKPSIDLSLTNSLLATSSPKGMYVFFLLALCKNFFESARDNKDMERPLTALVAFCPNRKERERIWLYYEKLKKESGNNTFQPSIMAVGELISYLSESLEFEESSTGGLM